MAKADIEIEFRVYGNPKSLQRHRTTKSGHRYDPSAGDKKDFLALAITHKPKAPLEGAICLRVNAYFSRPKSHYFTGKRSSVLRDNAPTYHTNTPDADNILKFVGDALNGIFWRDDKQIAFAKVAKWYIDESDGVCGPHVFVQVHRLVAENF